MNDKKHLITLLAVVPGIGHILFGLYIRGIVLFFIVAFLFNLWLMNDYLFPVSGNYKGMGNGFFAAGAIVWVYAFSDVVRTNYIRVKKEREEFKNLAATDFFLAYLNGDYSTALNYAKNIIAEDKYMPDGYLLAAKCYFRLGKLNKSKKILNTASVYDREKRWFTELTKMRNHLDKTKE